MNVRYTLQVSLDAFDRSGRPLCGDRPDQNGFCRLCLRCPFAVRDDARVYCERFETPIRAREKYALQGWKKTRRRVLERDRERCAICGTGQDLHIHHIDRDPSNDDLANLMTLCEICHARVHAGLRHEDGEERVIRVLQAAMKRNR
jgi:hypothetical protein